MKGHSAEMSTFVVNVRDDILLLSNEGKDAASSQGFSSLCPKHGLDRVHQEIPAVFEKVVQQYNELVYYIVVYTALTMYRAPETWQSKAQNSKKEELKGMIKNLNAVDCLKIDRQRNDAIDAGMRRTLHVTRPVLQPQKGAKQDGAKAHENRQVEGTASGQVELDRRTASGHGDDAEKDSLHSAPAGSSHTIAPQQQLGKVQFAEGPGGLKSSIPVTPAPQADLPANTPWPFQKAVECQASGQVHGPAQATGQQDQDSDEEASHSSPEVIEEAEAEEAASGLSQNDDQATGQQDHDADEEASHSSLEVIDEKAAEEAAFGPSQNDVQAAGTDEEPETRQDQAMASGHDELDPRAASGHGELSPRAALGEGAAVSAEVEVSPVKRKAFFVIFAGQGESGKET